MRLRVQIPQAQAWGLYSVPAWSPKGTYAEWYQHALQEKTQNGQVYEYHVKTYGKNFAYKDFYPLFKAELWNPDEWAGLIREAGAKYIVLTSKHHAGDCLWPSREASRAYGRPWNTIEAGPRRDIVGELTAAARRAGIRMGLYYSLYEWYHPFWATDKKRFVSEHLSPQFKDLITRYRPDIVWSDGGIVHQAWRPLPGRIKDYIAMPKPNFYQALHTTLVPENAPPFEVQIRTRDMDLIAENGIASHWKYKEGKLDPRADEASIGMVRQLLETTKEISDPREFLTALRIDLYPDEVYTFSPKGVVFSFPRGATPVDFAYRIHTDVGHRCVGARVNGKLVPLKTALQNGDIVEILTSPSGQPSRDWLAFAVTSRAKNKIRGYIHAAEGEIDRDRPPAAGAGAEEVQEEPPPPSRDLRNLRVYPQYVLL